MHVASIQFSPDPGCVCGNFRRRYPVAGVLRQCSHQSVKIDAFCTTKAESEQAVNPSGGHR